MTPYIILYVELNMFCSLLILFYLLHSFRSYGATQSQRRFIPAMLSLIVFFLSDMVWYMMDRGVLPQVIALSMLIKSIYFLSASSNGFFWMYYFETIMKEKMIRHKSSLPLLITPLAIHVLLCLINTKVHLLFYIDENFVYHRGDFFILQYVITYTYIIIPCVHAFVLASRKQNYVDRNKYLLIAFFPVLPAIGGIMQLFLWRIPFNCVFTTLASTIIYLGGLSQHISLEPLTGLNNKHHTMQDIELYIQSKAEEDPLYLLMLDMNRFKLINDNYGHLEGDYAICTVADILKKAANEMVRDSATEIRKRITIGRYGGDEFIIAAIAEEEDVLFLKAMIHDHLAGYNKISGKPYQLSTSIGIAKWSDQIDSIKTFIEMADQELYKEKVASRNNSREEL